MTSNFLHSTSMIKEMLIKKEVLNLAKQHSKILKNNSKLKTLFACCKNKS